MSFADGRAHLLDGLRYQVASQALTAIQAFHYTHLRPARWALGTTSSNTILKTTNGRALEAIFLRGL